MTRSYSQSFVLAATIILFGYYGSVHPQSVRAQSNPGTAVDSLLLKGKAVLSEGLNTGSIDSLKRARALFSQAVGGTEFQAWAHYYVALANYRINNQLPDDAEEDREKVLQDATQHLQQATELDADMADAWALLTGVYGQRMGLNPITKGVTLGPKADDAISKARDLAPKNPRVWIISGTQDFFTPSIFGGDKEQALEKFEKAARLAAEESVDDPLPPSWGHAEAYAWIGIAHMDAERYEDARKAFEQALDVNPNYGWVKLVLLPELNDRA